DVATRASPEAGRAQASTARTRRARRQRGDARLRCRNRPRRKPRASRRKPASPGKARWARRARRKRRAMPVPERTADEHDQRYDEDPFRPEITLRTAEDPRAHGNEVDQAVLEGQRSPPCVARIDGRPFGRQLAEDAFELCLRPRAVRLVETFLKFVQGEPPGLVVRPELTGYAGAVGIGDE